MQSHIWKKQVMFGVLDCQNRTQSKHSSWREVLDYATAGREKKNWKAGLDVTEIFTDLHVGKMDPDNKD